MVRLLFVLAILAGVLRAVLALNAVLAGNAGPLLAYPLTVILPLMAFAFLAQIGQMASQEGVLMQLGCLLQILLILAMPSLALYLALGFPVVFLVVELFETRCPVVLRDALKARVIA